VRTQNSDRKELIIIKHGRLRLSAYGFGWCVLFNVQRVTFQFVMSESEEKGVTILDAVRRAKEVSKCQYL